MDRLDEEKGAGKKEDYFDLIDFREIALKNWGLFQDLLSYEKKGNKEAKTDWIRKLNDMRKIVMHPAKERVIDWEQLSLLQDYDEWLNDKIAGRNDTEDYSTN